MTMNECAPISGTGQKSDSSARTDFHYVRTPSQLAALAKTLLNTPRFAVDVESDSFYHYYEKVCLLQVSAGGVDYVVDPLQVSDLSVLREPFARPDIEKVFHAATNDLDLLFWRHDIRVKGLFDTMVAARVVGHARLGLSVLVEHYCGVHLEKRFQRYDWSRRPLSHEHLDYARLDTHYLLRLRDALWEELGTLNRHEQALEEMRLVEDREPVKRVFSPESCLRIRGARQLDDIGKRVLRALFVARDREARRRDVAPFRVVRDDVLLAIARDCPTSDQALQRVRGTPRHMPPALRSLLLIAVEEGLRQQEPVEPTAPVRSSARRGAGRQDHVRTQARLSRLKDWRRAQAEIEQVPADVVVTNAVLHTLAHHPPRSMEQLEHLPGVRRWQVERYGEAWLRLLSGRSGRTPGEDE